MTTPTIRATELGEFIRYKSCQRRFKLGFNNRELAKALPFAGRLFATLDPVLQEAGRKREEEWEKYLRKLGFSDLAGSIELSKDRRSINWNELQDLLHSLKKGQNAYIRELAVSGQLGAFKINGCIDFVLLIWRKGKAKIRLVECKASRKDQTYHRAQLAVYKIIVSELLCAGAGLTIAGTKLSASDIECVVARIDEGTNRGQAIMKIPTFDLAMIEKDVLRLLQKDGSLERILATPLEELNYQIESKCDDCIFNIHCLPESARQKNLHLLSCDPSNIRAMKDAGVNNLTDLANLDLEGAQSQQISSSSQFSGSLQFLKAKAFARLSTLPDPPDKCYPVQLLSYRIFSQLPEHDIFGQRLLRVYLCVEYDYSENRIAAISAHVSSSDGLLYTGWQQKDGRKIPNPETQERVYLPSEDASRRQYEERPLRGCDVVAIQDKAWTGFYDWDNESERQLLESFFQSLVEAIKEEAQGRTHAPLHFYVWNRNEISRLVEACSRCSSDLLGHLQELLGCRESLEQMIYSCVQDEINNRFALGWTGRGLLVASSLNWYGWTYHWNRRVNNAATWIDREMSQDLFDFKAELNFENGNWLEGGKDKSKKHLFELRSQFNDNLPVGYLHAFWGVLSEPKDKNRESSNKALAIFRNAQKPGLLIEYLKARSQALRWLEERVEWKSSALQKPPVFLSELPKFSLKVNNPAKASIDFLRLDFHIEFSDWLARHLVAPKERIISGRTIPVRNVISKGNRLQADIDLNGFGMSKEELQIRSSFEEQSFVRLSPCQEDPAISQTLAQFGRGGITCIIESLDWKNGKIEMSALSLKDSDRYRMSSRSFSADSLIFANATIDENPSDFVSGRVEKRLESKLGSHAYTWFDRTAPKMPEANLLGDVLMHPYRKLVKSFKPNGVNQLAADQINAILSGLESNTQLLQGPPGTGKTMTTAVAILIRILAQHKNKSIVMVSANTHTAIDTLLERIVSVQAELRQAARDTNLEMPELALFKIESASRGSKLRGVQILEADDHGLQQLKQGSHSAVAIVAGTCGSLLKLCQLDRQLRSDMLIVDEASMMVFPHFLALATCVKEAGRFMLAGDHRQLSPILAHDWEKEDRPPAILYQPYASAYDAIRALSAQLNERQIVCSALQYTFRLPDEIRRLIARLYKLDEVELEGGRKEKPTVTETNARPSLLQYGHNNEIKRGSRAVGEKESFRSIWEAETGLYLVSHNERESRQSNPLELEIIRMILMEGGQIPPNSVAIVTPHRAQRALLQARLQDFSESVDLIDTVERLQGGERPTVIFSATVSDPSAIAGSVEFILDLNRSNVAFSRAKQRLIVVCSEELINFIPPSLAQYDEAMLWKSLREVCCRQIAEIKIAQHKISLNAV